MPRRPAPRRPRLATTASLLAALAAIAPLLAACGPGGANSGAGKAASTYQVQVDDPGKDGVRVTSLTFPKAYPSPSPTRSGSVVSADPVYPESGISAAYEITNNGTETLTYTVVVTFMSADGGAMGNETATVRGVRPKTTVRGTVRADEPFSMPQITKAKVLEATKVPDSEAPAAPGTCPASGVRVSIDEGDAAMGLRIVGLHLDNCGTHTYTVDGYPLLKLLDDDRKPVDGIKILDGSGEITTGAGPDEPPRPVTLKPGESATSALVWRNTTLAGTSVNVPYVQVRAKAGADPVTVTPHLDLGTTGKLGVKPWAKASAP